MMVNFCIFPVFAGSNLLVTIPGHTCKDSPGSRSWRLFFLSSYRLVTLGNCSTILDMSRLMNPELFSGINSICAAVRNGFALIFSKCDTRSCCIASGCCVGYESSPTTCVESIY